MEIEFDPVKDAANQAKHGLSLADAAAFEIAAAVVHVDDRFDYGEVRLAGWMGRAAVWCSSGPATESA